MVLGHIAPFDISDVCGMNLYNIEAGFWDEKLLELAAGDFGVEDLKAKLGDFPADGGIHLGNISSYYVRRHGFSPDCTFVASTDDNPATIFALPLRSQDAIVSLGTSTTFLMFTPKYKREPATHFKLGLYFPKPEIIPNLPSGQWHFLYCKDPEQLIELEEGWARPEEDARAIVESQMLSLRLRSTDLVSSPMPGLPPQPRRVFLVGGGSRNKAISKVVGEVLGGSDGIFKLDMAENTCALGAAYKTVWSLEQNKNETFDELIGRRWEESDFMGRIADGYQKGV
jgi:xylulokinase